MAFVDIPEEPMKKFLKAKNVWAKIGDKLDAVYVSDEPSNDPEKYGQEYTFAIDGTERAAMSGLPGALRAQLKKAKAAGQLRPGARVVIQFAKTVPTKHSSPAKSFKVAIDPDYKGAAPKNGKNVFFEERKTEDFGGFDAGGDDAPPF